MFTAALFTTAMMWEQPKSPCTDDWLKKMWYINNRMLFSVKKKREIFPFVELEYGTWVSYADWNIRQKKTKTVWSHLYVEFKEKTKNNHPPKKTNQTHRKRDKTCGYHINNTGDVILMYSVMTTVNTVLWYIWELQRE